MVSAHTIFVQGLSTPLAWGCGSSGKKAGSSVQRGTVPVATTVPEAEDVYRTLSINIYVQHTSPPTRPSVLLAPVVTVKELDLDLLSLPSQMIYQISYAIPPPVMEPKMFHGDYRPCLVTLPAILLTNLTSQCDEMFQRTHTVDRNKEKSQKVNSSLRGLDGEKRFVAAKR